MSKETGGPAFPSPADDKKGWEPEYGMNLRDWFAGMALQGRLSQKQISSPNNGYDRLASDCYEIADAVIKARSAQ